MVIKVKDLEIHSYDPNDAEQNHLKYALNNDKSFRQYVTKNLSERLKESIDLTTDECLKYNHSYFVKYKEEYVGYIRLEDLRVDGSLRLQIAVSPEYRNQNLATKILNIVSDYILEHLPEVSKLQGVIEKNNYASRGVAKNTGYIEEKRDDFYVYVARNRR